MQKVPDVLKQYVSLTFQDGKAFTGETTIECDVEEGTTSIGLHAFRLKIDSAYVGGELCDCHTSPWWDEVLQDSRRYKACLLREVQPELIIDLPVGFDAETRQEDGRYKLEVVIKYSGSAGESGIRQFNGGVVTCQQLARARAWVPCVDLHNKFTSWNLVLKVPPGSVVVAPGDLKSCPSSNEASSESGKWEYDIPHPVPARCIVLVIGRFNLFVDERPPAVLSSVAEFLIPAEDVAGHGGDGGTATGPIGDCPGVTCFAPEKTAAVGELNSTCGALALIQSFLEHRLQCRVPWPLYSQVFLPEEVCQGPGRHFGPGVTVLSQASMCEEKALEQRMTSRIALAGALAEQWFGGLLVAATAADRWLEWGLQGYLQMLFIRAAYGSNEARYARIKQRDAVVAADNGLMPPLSWRAPPHSPEDVYILTESLHYTHALRMKATAIVLTLESKCGSDAFLPIVRSLVHTALASRAQAVPPQPPRAADPAPQVATGVATGDAAAPVPWMLTSAVFLKQVSQVGGFRREIGSFAERWIYGTGCPQIRAAFCLRNTADNVVEVALQQTGSAAAKRSADRALAADRQHAGVIRVTVRELETINEHAIFLGGEGVTLHSLRLSMKVNQRRNKRRADAIDDSELQGSNILHCLVDPHSEWLACTTVLQSEAMLKMQLLHMRDVDAQHAAVKALSHLITEVREGKVRHLIARQTRGQPDQAGLGDVHRILVMVLKDPNYFYRVRMDAAQALGNMASLVIPDPRNGNHEFPALALSTLLAFYREAACDPSTGAHLPLDFRDLAAYHVRLAVLAALARARTVAGRSPEDALAMLVRAIEQAESRSTKYGSIGFRVAVLESLAYVAPASPRELERVLNALQSNLMRDAAIPSHGGVVSVAALSAAARLAAAFPASKGTISSQLAIVSDCSSLPPQVRVAAAQSRVGLCEPNLSSILAAASLSSDHQEAPKTTNKAPEDVEMAEAATPADQGASEPPKGTVQAPENPVFGSMRTEMGSFCPLAQAAALTAAAHRLHALHVELSTQVGGTAARKRSAEAAGFDFGEDDEPPQAAVAALSPMLSMHAVPALRHEAFKALNASVGHEPSLICLAAAETSDVGGSGLVTTHGGRGAASAAATAATGGDTANKPQRKKLILKKLTHDAATSRPSVPSPSATAATGATAAGAAGGEEEVSQGGADPGATQSGGATTGGAAGEPSEAAAPPSNLDSQSPEEQGGATMTTDAGGTANAADDTADAPMVSGSVSVHAAASKAATAAVSSEHAAGATSPRVAATAGASGSAGASQVTAAGAAAEQAGLPTTAAAVPASEGAAASAQGAIEKVKEEDKSDKVKVKDGKASADPKPDKKSGEGSSKKKDKKKDKDKDKSKKEKKEKKDKDKSHKKEKKEKKEKKDKDKKSSEKAEKAAS